MTSKQIKRWHEWNDPFGGKDLLAILCLSAFALSGIGHAWDAFSEALLRGHWYDKALTGAILAFAVLAALFTVLHLFDRLGELRHYHVSERERQGMSDNMPAK